jgi:predicted acetyltransferase
MQNIKLEFPNILHKQAYLAMVQEWEEYENIPTDPDCLFMGETYEEFLTLCESKKFY